MKTANKSLKFGAHLLALAGIFTLSSCLTGCGMGDVQGFNSTDVNPAAMTGHVRGGPNPIVGAAVTLYATTSASTSTAANGAYSGTATALTSTITDANGNFTFPSTHSYTCTANQFAYVTVAGGNTGGGGSNPGKGATATATISGGVITGITVTNGGSGYTSAPTVVISDPTGSAATATAILGTGANAGTVTSITVTAGGGGYTQPTVALQANSSNPNSLLMTAIGPCANLTTSTFIYVDELTTIAAAYALSNFISITGNSTSGYTVNVTSSATNNSTAASGGCVHNAYYGTGTCAVTATYGLGHAFANANNLVNYTTGQVTGNGTTPTGATIPLQLISELGNALQACVNSTGGGTTSGAPNTTTSSGTTTTDGTACGNLSGYTSYYTANTSGTLIASGNTLGMMQNLAKRPSGSASTTFTNSTTTQCSGAAATCIFNLGSSTGFYQPSMSAAPPDWTMAISWPKGSFSSATDTTSTCTGALPPSTGNNGILYPFMLATDINDNIDIINGDASTAVCTNVISIGFDGSKIAATAFDTTGALPNWIANDSFGHSIVPVHGTGGSGNANNGVRIYATGQDTTDTLINTYEYSSTSASTNGENLPFFVAIDGNDTIWITNQAGATTPFGWLSLNGTANSHSSPSYTAGVPSNASNTAKGLQAAIDINNNFFSAGSSGSGGSRPYIIPATAPATLISSPPAYVESSSTDEDAGSTSNGLELQADISGNVWMAYTAQVTPVQGTAPAADYTFSTPYTGTTFGTTPGKYNATATTNYNYKIEPGQIDGNNVMWWGDVTASSSITESPAGTVNANCTGTSGTTELCFAHLQGFDTVNQDYLPILVGCEFFSASSTACGTQSTDATYPSSNPYAFYSVHGVAIDSAGDVWTANGTQGKVTEVIGIAAPSWPMFIHNGSSNKP